MFQRDLKKCCRHSPAVARKKAVGNSRKAATGHRLGRFVAHVANIKYKEDK